MMENAASDAQMDATTIRRAASGNRNGLPSASTFPFFQLPRELRDQIYDYTFSIPDPRGDRALRIERRHLKHFSPSACSILLLLHHEYFLLNRRTAREALEILLKHHTIFFSCGPYVLKQLLLRIEEQGGPCKQWLQWIKRIELDWVTFPNLRSYPPDRNGGKDEWWWERDGIEVDVDYIRGAEYNGHYDEHDYEGGYYDDNFYSPDDASLYPSYLSHASASVASSQDDLFGFSSHYPFADPSLTPNHGDGTISATEDIATRLDLLVAMEVTPLFAYLSTPAFSSLSSITLPLYFISKQAHYQRNQTRPGYALPLKLRYWVQVTVHALLMLQTPSSFTLTSKLKEVRIKYQPWDIWATMDPADDLGRMVKKGIWFNEREDAQREREGEGEAFRAVWTGLQELGLCKGKDRMGLSAEVKLVKWEGDLDKWRVGDELEVVFTKGK